MQRRHPVHLCAPLDRSQQQASLARHQPRKHITKLPKPGRARWQIRRKHCPFSSEKMALASLPASCPARGASPGVQVASCPEHPRLDHSPGHTFLDAQMSARLQYRQACKAGDTARALELLTSKHLDPAMSPRGDAVGILLAAWHGHMDTVEALLQHGGAPGDLASALSIAWKGTCYSGALGTFKAFVQLCSALQAHPAAVLPCGTRATLKAAEQGDEALVTYLLSLGRDVAWAADLAGAAQDAFKTALSTQHLDVAAAILRQASAREYKSMLQFLAKASQGADGAEVRSLLGDMAARAAEVTRSCPDDLLRECAALHGNESVLDADTL